jgi:hypothetical protein
LFGIAAVVCALILLFVVGADGVPAKAACWMLLVLGCFWYVIMGHALIYGPHLFLIAIRDGGCALARAIHRGSHRA